MVQKETAGATDGKHDWAAYEAIVEKRCDYYLARFRRFSQGRLLSWNWAAFFATFAWFRYRKMIGWSWAYFFVSTPVLILLALGHVVGGDECARALADYHVKYTIWGFILIGLFGWILPPLFADRIYFNHVHALVEKNTPAAVALPKAGHALTRFSGTGGFLAALFAQFVMILVGVVVFPSFANYSLRLRVSEGLSVANTAWSFREDHGRVPRLPQEVSLGRYVSGIEFLPDGTIKAVLSGEAKQLNGRSISLVPHRADGKLEWTCLSDDLPDACLPRTCRHRIKGSPISRPPASGRS